jgi:arsenate reductase (glutaredoxin)
MAVTIYHNPRCSTSRSTLALLQKKGIAPKVVEYLETPLDAEGLKGLLKKLKLSARALLRKKEAAPLGLDTDAMTEAQLIATMVKHPILMQRPVVVSGAKAVIARPPETALEIL